MKSAFRKGTIANWVGGSFYDKRLSSLRDLCIIVEVPKKVGTCGCPKKHTKYYANCYILSSRTFFGFYFEECLHLVYAR